MAELRTRIVLRNDSTANWLVNESVVLLKGEVGIEFLENGKAKVKIGDGIKTWAQLDYFGGDEAKINEILESVGVLQTDLSALKGIVGEAATEESEASGLFALLNEKANKEDVYTKAETEALVSKVYRYCGSKATYAELPTEGQAVGDVWNIETADEAHGIKAGDNVAWNGEAWDRLAGTVDLSGYVTAEQFSPVKEAVDELPLYYLTKEQAAATMPHVEYEISNKPTGALVDYRDKEIRVMCPADTAWALQNVGENGDPSRYYIGFKAYAPNDNVVSFKEDIKATIEDDTMNYFEGNDFAGIDKYGRKYSIVWLPVAAYNAETDSWTYYGANSSEKKFIGWYYSVEWYNAEGKVVKSDTIRINLSNELCYNSVAPFYAADVITSVKLGGALLDVVNKQVNIPIASNTLLGVVMSSDVENKVSVAEDGTMEVNSVNVNKLVQDENDVLILNGGSSSV